MADDAKIQDEKGRKKMCWLPIFRTKTESELNETIFYGVETSKRLSDLKSGEDTLENY